MEESDWNLVDMQGELMTCTKRKISLENEAETSKIFVEGRLLGNEIGSHKNSPVENKTENNEATSIFEQNPVVEINKSSSERNPGVEIGNELSFGQNSVQDNTERNDANSGRIPPESLSVMSENPAIEILNWVRHGMRIETIPKHIDNFIKSQENYKKTLTVQFAHHFEKVLGTANQLDKEISDKLFYLRSNIFKCAYTWVKKNRPKSYNPINYFFTNCVEKEENDQRLPIQQQITSSSSSQDTFVLPNGKNPTLFCLTKNISHDLDQLIDKFTLTKKSCDKLDRAIFELIGLRLYSNEFLNLCEFCKNNYPNNEEFEGLPVSLNSFHRENISEIISGRYFCKNSDPNNEEFEGLPVSLNSFHLKNISEMIRDSNMVEKLKILSGILDHDFYKKVAFSFVNDIFLKYPQDYSSIYEETYLESLQKACNMLHIISASENSKDFHSIDIQKGIIEMECVIHKMAFISGSSSSD